MLLIGFTSAVYFSCSQLFEAFVELSGSPVEPVLVNGTLNL